MFLSINPPFISFYNRFNNQSNYQTWDWYNPTAGLPAGGIQFSYIPSDSVMPYLQAWSLGVQHEIAGNVVDITYVGNKDSHLRADVAEPAAARSWRHRLASSVHQRFHGRR